MPNIKILPKHVQNMIAAGEVVERPANVIKELIENSLDAGADNIYCEIQGGGDILIVVQDNGIGMDKDDLRLAVKRHATSKLYSHEDLFAISSFGFRGEALPSIGSVSHLKICSKTEKDEYGHVIEVIFGEEQEISVCAMNKGTKVEVRDLFLKVPARLKFMKSKNVEAKKCQEIFYKIALCHLDKDFVFVREGKQVLNFFKGEDFLTRLSNIWPARLVSNFREVQLVEGDYRVYGYVGDPKYPQARGDRIIFYVNKRPIKDKLLLKALKQAYSGKILGREYPCGVIFIDMPFNEVDVNVHPAKMEVKFRDESYIISIVYRAVKGALDKIYASFFENKKQDKIDLNGQKSELKTNYHFNKDILAVKEDSFDKDYLFSINKVFKEERKKTKEKFIYIGQIANTYIVIKEDERLIILDQHAVHERILFENFKNKIKRAQQRLLNPIEIKLYRDIDEKDIKIFLEQSGFQGKIENDKLIITSYPSFLDIKETKECLTEFFLGGKIKIDDFIEIIACKRAIKAGQYLTDHETEQLIKEWLKCENRDFCPHGRPTNIIIEKNMLEKMFKRKA